MAEMSDAFLDEFRNEFNRNMKALEEKYDITVDLGRITYSQNMFSATVTVHLTRDQFTNEAAECDRQVWRYAHLGLSEGMYMRIFENRKGEQFALRGFNPRSKQYPILAYRIEDGVEFKLGAGNVYKITDRYYAKAIE